MSDEGYLTSIGTSLRAPSQSLSWTQLAAATVFVMVVAIAWRQIIHMIVHTV
jgi:hypothetical protein